MPQVKVTDKALLVAKKLALSLGLGTPEKAVEYAIKLMGE